MTASFTIRAATPADIPALQKLFEAGVTDGQVRTNDTGADIDNLDAGYFQDDGRSGFWVADAQPDVVGMVGVQQVADGVAEIRRLRVRSEYRRKGIGGRLLQHAVQFCRDGDFMKIVLDVRTEREPAIKLFEAAGFLHSRTREVGSHVVVEFYVDLYTDPATRG